MIVLQLKRKQRLLTLSVCYLFQAACVGFVYLQMPSTLMSALAVVGLLLVNAVIFIWGAWRFRLIHKPRNEELLPFILNDLNDGIFDYDIVTDRITYSQSYLAMLGYTGAELDGTQADFYQYVHPDDLDDAVKHMKRYLRQEITSYYNIFRVRHKEGHWVWLMSRGIGLRDAHGKFYRMLGTHTDITEQKRREEDLKRLVSENETQRLQLVASKEKAESANQAKTDFLATMSHEIRTPMNAVTGLAEIMLKTKLEPRQQQMMETLHANTGILLRLVNNILDFERIDTGQIDFESHNFTFKTVMANLSAMFAGQAATKGLQLALVNELGDQAFSGDCARLEQIFINLVGNALKFTIKGGIAVTVHANGAEEPVVITVADTGVGIPHNKLAAIFDRFVQADQTISRRFGGSGLGLAISRSLARLMNGDITVASEVGSGSTFTVTLPLRRGAVSTEAPNPLKAPVEHADPPAAGGDILLVEDHAANVLVATMMLQDLNYTVDVASSGAEALAKLKERTSPYLVILMDVQMHGLDGYETTRHIRALEASKGFCNRIVGVTANALIGDRDKCIEAGMDDYMSKPIDSKILRQKISGSSVVG